MGQLPSHCVQLASPFMKTGMDFAGPYLCKRENILKLVQMKAYVCLFICLLTKVIHLELVTDLTTEEVFTAFTLFLLQ